MLSLVTIMLAGACNGVMDRISFHWRRAWPWMKSSPGRERFWRVVPPTTLELKGINARQIAVELDDFDLEPLSLWTNKYKNGDPTQGAAFFLSTTWLVAWTDGWHLVKMFMKWLIFLSALLYTGSDGYLISDGWIRYLVDFGLLYVVWQLGFILTYKIL